MRKFILILLLLLLPLNAFALVEGEEVVVPLYDLTAEVELAVKEIRDYKDSISPIIIEFVDIDLSKIDLADMSVLRLVLEKIGFEKIDLRLKKYLMDTIISARASFYLEQGQYDKAISEIEKSF